MQLILLFWGFLTVSDADLLKHINLRISNFRGDITNLEHAIGCFYVGRQLGWKVMLLIHDRKSIKKYEDLLALNFKEHMPEVGSLAHKSLAWQAVQKVSSFWKAVKGEIANVRTTQVE